MPEDSNPFAHLIPAATGSDPTQAAAPRVAAPQNAAAPSDNPFAHLIPDAPPQPGWAQRATRSSLDAQKGGWAQRAVKSSLGAQKGQVVPGNINLHNRPVVKNPDGSISTVRSISINVDGKEVLIPTVVNGKVVSNQQAIDHFKKTGEHLGMFKDVASANAYAKSLHEAQAKEYAAPQPYVDRTLIPGHPATPMLKNPLPAMDGTRRAAMAYLDQKFGKDPRYKNVRAKIEKDLQDAAYKRPHQVGDVIDSISKAEGERMAQEQVIHPKIGDAPMYHPVSGSIVAEEGNPETMPRGFTQETADLVASRHGFGSAAPAKPIDKKPAFAAKQQEQRAEGQAAFESLGTEHIPIVGRVVGMLNPAAQTSFFVSLAAQPKDVAESLVNSINHIWGKDLDGNPVSAGDRANGLFDLTLTALGAEHGISLSREAFGALKERVTSVIAKAQKGEPLTAADHVAVADAVKAGVPERAIEEVLKPVKVAAKKAAPKKLSPPTPDAGTAMKSVEAMTPKLLEDIDRIREGKIPKPTLVEGKAGGSGTPVVEPLRESPAAPKVEGKLPWEITRGEAVAKAGLAEPKFLVERSHKEAVRQAIVDGKPVPPEVLADYPDLQSPKPPVPDNAGAGVAGGENAQPDLSQLEGFKPREGERMGAPGYYFATRGDRWGWWDGERFAEIRTPYDPIHGQRKVAEAADSASSPTTITVKNAARVVPILDNPPEHMKPGDILATESGARWVLGKDRVFEQTHGVGGEGVKGANPTNEPGTVHKFSSTQVDLPKGVAGKVRETGKKLIPDDALYTDPKDPSYGREEDPHVTVKYGIHADKADAIREALAGEPPIEFTLGKTSIFPAKDGSPYDVVKVDVESPDLHRLNAKIAASTDVTDTFPTYQPHVTLGYVKAGEGAKFAGKTDLEGQRVTVDRITFSGKNGETVEVPLGGKSDAVVDPTRQAILDTIEAKKAAYHNSQSLGTLGGEKLSLAIEIGGHYLELGLHDFKAWSKEMVSALGDAVVPHLEEIWKQVKGETDAEQVEKSAEIHGNVRGEPVKGEGQVPAEEGRGGVRENAAEGVAAKGQKESAKAEVGTALQKKVINAARRQAGLPELKTTPKPMEEAARGAVEKGYHKPDVAVRMAENLNAGITNSLDHEQTVGMAAALDGLLDQHAKLADAYGKTAEKGGDLEMARELGDLTDKINEITQAGTKAGTEWGRSGVARQAMMKADGSFAGIVARRQRVAGRSLTTTEITEARTQAEALKKIIDLQDKRIADLETKIDAPAAQRRLNEYKSGKSGGALGLDERIRATSERLKDKWKEHAPPPVLSSSLFGVDIAAAQVARLAHVAPELLELAKLKVMQGYTSLAENTREVVRHLKDQGIMDISENDVAAVLAGKVKTEAAAKTLSDYEMVKVQARRAFQDVKAEKDSALRKAAQEDREQKTAESRAKKKQAMQDARDAREAEAWFWKWVGEKQRAWEKNQKAELKLDRDNYKRFWKASVGAQRAKLLNSIESLQDKLKVYHEEGVIPGAKSRLKLSDDPVVQDLRIKEAALRNQIDHATALIQEKANLDLMPQWRQVLKRWNPWTVARSFVASFDNSFPFNQGAMALWSDPKQWAKGAKASFRGFTEAGAHNVMAEMRAHPNWEKADAAGLFEGKADIEDIYGGTVDLPGIKQSESMYDTAAKATRFHLFNEWLDMAEKTTGRPQTLEDIKVLATEVKRWTGQGLLGKNTDISKGFFSLRYRLSQFEVAFGAPLAKTFRYGRESGNYAPFKVMLRRYGRAYATMAATTAVAKIALNRAFPNKEWDIDLDSNSANFGFLVHKVGNTVHRYAVLPGAFRVYGLLSQLWTGTKESMMGTQHDASKFKDRSLRQEIVGNWVLNGLHPGISGPLQAKFAQDDKNKMAFGKSYDFSKADGYLSVGSNFLPISVQNVIEVWGNKDMSVAEKAAATSLLPMIDTNTATKQSNSRQGDRSGSRASGDRAGSR